MTLNELIEHDAVKYIIGMRYEEEDEGETFIHYYEPTKNLVGQTESGRHMVESIEHLITTVNETITEQGVFVYTSPDINSYDVITPDDELNIEIEDFPEPPESKEYVL